MYKTISSIGSTIGSYIPTVNIPFISAKKPSSKVDDYDSDYNDTYNGNDNNYNNQNKSQVVTQHVELSEFVGGNQQTQITQGDQPKSMKMREIDHTYANNFPQPNLPHLKRSKMNEELRKKEQSDKPHTQDQYYDEFQYQQPQYSNQMQEQLKQQQQEEQSKYQHQYQQHQIQKQALQHNLPRPETIEMNERSVEKICSNIYDEDDINV